MKANKIIQIISIGIISFFLGNQFILRYGILPFAECTIILGKKEITEPVSDKHATRIPKNSYIIDSIKINDNHQLSYLDKKNRWQQVSSSETFLNKNPNFLLYVFFLSLSMSVSIILIGPLIKKTKTHLTMLRNKEIIVFSLLSALFTAIMFIISNIIPYAWEPQQIINNLNIFLTQPIIIMMTFLTPLLILTSICIFGILGISVAIKNLKFSLENRNEFLKLFINYKTLLNEYVMILGTITASGAIVISSTLANAINDCFPQNALIKFVPSEFVYLYGLSFTSGILLIYIPVYAYLIEKGKMFLSEVNPMDFEGLEQWNKKNNIYAQLLGIHMDLWEGLKISLRVLFPLITSILASIIQL